MLADCRAALAFLPVLDSYLPIATVDLHTNCKVAQAGARSVAAKPILVAGGAGYIGSHFCHVAARKGYSPVVIDSIGRSSQRVQDYRRRSVARFPLIECDIGDDVRVREAIAHHRPVAAVCFAALIEVAESVAMPSLYWDNNYVRAMRFFRMLATGGVRHLVFSSTAAVYGGVGADPLAETHQLAPASPYGETKLACELMLQGASENHQLAGELSFPPLGVDWPPPPSGEKAHFVPTATLAFRYFNAAGGHVEAGLGEVHEPESHLIPRLLAAALGNTRDVAATINGDDYDTPDGTCVRDYVHVLDLAEAHVAGLDYLLDGGKSDVFNLGCGSGYSIRQVLAAVEQATGASIPARIGARRAGDTASLIADSGKVRRVLGWQPQRNLDQIVATAAAFHRVHGVQI
jgi:UDP-glucose 4-epimerase